VKYHPLINYLLTSLGHFMLGSLAGAAASKKVAEAYKGRLK